MCEHRVRALSFLFAMIHKNGGRAGLSRKSKSPKGTRPLGKWKGLDEILLLFINGRARRKGKSRSFRWVSRNYGLPKRYAPITYSSKENTTLGVGASCRVTGEPRLSDPNDQKNLTKEAPWIGVEAAAGRTVSELQDVRRHRNASAHDEAQRLLDAGNGEGALRQTKSWQSEETSLYRISGGNGNRCATESFSSAERTPAGRHGLILTSQREKGRGTAMVLSKTPLGYTARRPARELQYTNYTGRRNAAPSP